MSVLSVDFHTHILPGIDDGCSNVDEALQVLRMEYAQGIKIVYLTPHFDANVDFPENFVENRKKSFENLVSAIGEDQELPELVLGAEVRFCPGISLWDQLPQLALGNTKYILIEMPDFAWSDSTHQELMNIYLRHGLIPVLAHIERYFTPLKICAMLRKLKSLPVILQVNCDFIIDKRTRRLAKRLLRNGLVHIIGSDCHSATWRAPNVEYARMVVEGFANEKQIKRIVDNERLIAQSNECANDLLY